MGLGDASVVEIRLTTYAYVAVLGDSSRESNIDCREVLYIHHFINYSRRRTSSPPKHSGIEQLPHVLFGAKQNFLCLGTRLLQAMYSAVVGT